MLEATEKKVATIESQFRELKKESEETAQCTQNILAILEDMRSGQNFFPSFP